jgi:hypothetical protein
MLERGSTADYVLSLTHDRTEAASTEGFIYPELKKTLFESIMVKK